MKKAKMKKTRKTILNDNNVYGSLRPTYQAYVFPYYSVYDHMKRHGITAQAAFDYIKARPQKTIPYTTVYEGKD